MKTSMKTLATTLGFLLLTQCDSFSTAGISSYRHGTQRLEHRRSSWVTTSSSRSHSSHLSAKRGKGRLSKNISIDEDGALRRISNKRKQKLGSEVNSKREKKLRQKGKGEAAGISPLLAAWADDDGGSSVDTATSPPKVTTNNDTYDDDDDDDDAAVTFAPFQNDKKSKRRQRKGKSSGSAPELSPAQSARLSDLLASINDQVSTTNCDVPNLIASIKSLVELGSTFGNNNQVMMPTLKSIVGSKPMGEEENQPSYRLAWVGSDEAICHIGTSLHKVPLARLQEMYLLLGYNRWELLEVIRILGPFPNVRNTLKGDVKLSKLSGEREGVRTNISYTSMIDGTGKEILAGEEVNVKNVELDVWFANEEALVCTTPSEDGSDPFAIDGTNILYFVREENLDEELEKLRAA